MERHAFAFKIKEGCFAEFRECLGRIWPDLTALLDGIGADNFSLWGIGEDLVFGYYETEEIPSLSEKDAAALQHILDQTQEKGEWISSPKQEMRLMYQDFGIVRQSKELIRHRVFATHLRGDFQEEYKARHDALVEARNGAMQETKALISR